MDIFANFDIEHYHRIARMIHECEENTFYSERDVEDNAGRSIVVDCVYTFYGLWDWDGDDKDEPTEIFFYHMERIYLAALAKDPKLAGWLDGVFWHFPSEVDKKRAVQMAKI